MPPTTAVIRTPDQRLRVFVSSTLQELAPERKAAREAIERLHLAPVMFELGARPHPPRDLYRAYLDQSHVFVGIYWQSYGWVAPGEQVSGLEDEYNLAGARPKLVYIKSPSPERQPRLKDLLDRVRNDGSVSYRSFTSPQELRKLLADDLALMLTESFEAAMVVPAPAPATTEPAPSRDLPLPSTPLVGRKREVAAVKDMLTNPGVRLVTLSGPGGIGKTRLALEVAAQLRGWFRDGVGFVPLSAVSDPSLVESMIAQALGVRESGESSVFEALSKHLAGKQMLLVLDNFEQVTSASQTVSRLLAAHPELKVLVTSRALLWLAGGTIFRFHRSPCRWGVSPRISILTRNMTRSASS